MSSTSFAIPSPSRSALAHLRTALGARGALLTAALTLAIASAVLIATHVPPRLAVPRPVALEHVLAAPSSRRLLDSVHWTRYDATAIDPRYELLGFYRGPELMATVGVGSAGGRIVVLDQTDLTHRQSGYGSNIANDVRVLSLLCGVFVLMTAVWPLWRLRNLDVLVAASTAVSIVLFDRWLLDRMVLVGYPALFYFAGRCGWWALGSGRSARPSTPLFEWLTRGWDPRERLRMLRLGTVVSGLVLAMVGLSSMHVLDVGYAVMEGATAITHGLLPYGHVTDVLHGDTYPIGSYLLYVPFASLSPVHSQWDSADWTLAVAVLSGLGVAWGLSRFPRFPRIAASDVARDRERDGLRAAIAWLTFPPLLVTVSTGTTDVALAAFLLAALALWRRPAAGAAVLSAAGWFKFVPAMLLPLWLARLHRRPLLWALAATASLSGLILLVLLALGGPSAPSRMLSAMSFQFTRESPHTLWALVGSVPLQQLTQAATLALVAGAAVRLHRDPELARDRARFAALCCAVLIGLQISGNYWSFLYLVWIFPFLSLSVLGDGVAT